MFFSVIVPIYGVEKYLPGCIESVLSQTFGDFELILVDDGSPDACPRICDAYSEKDSRVKVIHKENGGLVSARKAGAEAARGEYIFNLDGDDTLVPDTLECAHRIICEHGCDMVCFSYRWVESDGRCVGITTDDNNEGLYDRQEIKEHILPGLVMGKNMNHISFYLSGKAVKRELLSPIQLSVSSKISLGEDLCCTVPCYLNANSVYLSKKQAYLYLKRQDSMSKEFNCSQLLKVNDIIDEIYGFENIMENVPDLDEQVCRYSAFMCFAILAAAAEGNHFSSLKQLKEYILGTKHISRIKNAKFGHITPKTRIGIFLMKNKCIGAAFYFLNFCKNIKNLVKQR